MRLVYTASHQTARISATMLEAPHLLAGACEFVGNAHCYDIELMAFFDSCVGKIEHGAARHHQRPPRDEGASRRHSDEPVGTQYLSIAFRIRSGN